MRTRPWLAGLIGLPLLLTTALPAPAVQAAAPVRVILDGRTLALDSAPLILDDRTFVPLRGVFEAMGATAVWNGETRSVEVTRGDAYLRLTLGRKLACLSADCTRAAVLDAPARLVDSRTYVPVRFIAQAMGAKVSWEDARRAVVIDTARTPDTQPNAVALASVTPGQTVARPVMLQAAAEGGTGVQFYLLDPATGMGTIVAAGADPKGAYTYAPDPAVQGPRLLVAAVRDTSGVTRYSDPVPVQLAPDPQVSLTGLEFYGLVDGPISFSSTQTFPATHVAYRLINPDGTVEDLGTNGPGDKLTWYPQVSHNGDRTIQAIAYDRHGTAYPSAPIPVKVQSGYRAVLSGVTDGATLTRSVTLSVTRNYPVDGVKYVLDDQVLGWGLSYTWNFGPEANGPHKLSVEVTAKDGTVRTIGPISFTVNVTPTVRLSGVGPDQVVTGPATLKVSANVPLSGSVEYYVSDAGGQLQLAGRGAPDGSFAWTPTAKDAGPRSVQAVARDAAGNVLKTSVIKFRVYLGKVYGPVALVPKTDFKDLAVKLSLPVYREVGLSAALQVAQAMLETGSGQSVPVDKYTGQLSYNLFGIKGTGPNGTITSNTWEEYGGVAYRVDAEFRAYHNVAESWRDHADILLVRPWYAPVRAVMPDPVLGAWALKRSGYATDSAYPTKLINIMKANNLFMLDQFEF
ncbi:MAG TPA: stalk domain-containing protein [Symbiobacteriaceae bacterium]|jgi:hypothetical protein